MRRYILIIVSAVFLIVCSSASGAELDCSSAELDIEHKEQMYITFKPSIDPIRTAFSVANKKGLKNFQTKVIVRYSRDGRVVNSSLDHASGFDELDKALLDFANQLQVTKGYCGKFILPIAFGM